MSCVGSGDILRVGDAMIRLVYLIPVMLFFLAIRIVVILLGWIVCPIAVACEAYGPVKSKFWSYQVLAWDWKFMEPWMNWEDGLDNRGRHRPEWPLWAQILHWTCVKNPASGLRWLPITSCKIDPKRLMFTGTFGSNIHTANALLDQAEIKKYDTKVPHWFFAWQGVHSNFYWRYETSGKLYQVWLGSAKIYPTDVWGVTEYRKYGSGPVMQWHEVR